MKGSMSNGVVAVMAGVLVNLAVLPPPDANADPETCSDAFCTPGITDGVDIGAPCGDTTHYVFGTTSSGRLAFCGSSRRYAPRYFRSPPMAGVKNESDDCGIYPNQVAQAPDGLFLTCVTRDGHSFWERGDL